MPGGGGFGRTAFVRRAAAAAAAAAIGWLAGFPIESAPTPGSGTRNRMRGLGGGGKEGGRVGTVDCKRAPASQWPDGRLAIGHRGVSSIRTQLIAFPLPYITPQRTCSARTGIPRTKPSVRPSVLRSGWPVRVAHSLFLFSESSPQALSFPAFLQHPARTYPFGQPAAGSSWKLQPLDMYSRYAFQMDHPHPAERVCTLFDYIHTYVCACSLQLRRGALDM